MYNAVIVRTTSEAVEILAALCEDLEFLGLEIIDPNDEIYRDTYKGDWDYADPAYRPKGDIAILKVYIDKEADPDKYVSAIKAMLEGLDMDVAPGIVEVEKIEEKDWQSEWKKGFVSFTIGDRIVVKPSWEKSDFPKDKLVIEIDPGMAFGTGTHETTYTTVLALEKYLEKGDSIYDVGTGSGILSIAAMLLGAKDSVATDITEASIETSNKNVKANGFEKDIVVMTGDLLKGQTEVKDLIVANIIADVLVMMSEDAHSLLKDEGYLILSGIIDAKRKLIEDVFGEGFEHIERVTKGEWNTYVYRKK